MHRCHTACALDGLPLFPHPQTIPCTKTIIKIRITLTRELLIINKTTYYIFFAFEMLGIRLLMWISMYDNIYIVVLCYILYIYSKCNFIRSSTKQQQISGMSISCRSIQTYKLVIRRKIWNINTFNNNTPQSLSIRAHIITARYLK